jgi:hypothetical protein
MSKFNTRFSQLRINVGSEEIRNTAEKPKTNHFRDPNSLRIQSPKNLNTLLNRPVQVIYASPMTSKNENKNFLMSNFSKETQGINPRNVSKNANSGYLNTVQNKHDRMEMSAKAGKPNLLNIIKSNLRGKNNFENLNNLNSNYVNFQNLNVNSNGNVNNVTPNYSNYSGLNFVNTPQPRHPSNGNYTGNNAHNAHYPMTTKSSSLSRENKQFSTLTNNNNNNNINESAGHNLNKAKTINSINNYNKLSLNKNYNSNNLGNLNFINNKESLTNGGYLHSEGNSNNYAMNRQNFSNNRGSSNNQKGNTPARHNTNVNYSDNIHKNNLEILHRNLKGLNNNINNDNNSNNQNNNFNNLSAKRDNNYPQQQQQNLVKSERIMKSFSPNIKLESAFASEQKKKLLLKNSVKYFTNVNNIINNNLNHGNLTPSAQVRLRATANNISDINNNNDNSRIQYEDRVVHTDSGASAHSNRKINNNNNVLLSPDSHGNKNLIANSNKTQINTNNQNNNSNVNNNNTNQNANNNLNDLNSPINNNVNSNNNANNKNISNNNTNTNNNNNKEAGKPQLIDIMKLISINQPPISLNVLNKKFENFENSKYSTKSLKYIKGYSANTHQGTVR